MFGKSEQLIENINTLLDNHLQEKIDQAFANSFNLYLEKFRDFVDQEKEIISTSAKEAVEKINIASEKLSEIDQLISMSAKLAEETNRLTQEIRKRDAIIERKNKQIAKLKVEKNEI